MASGQNNILQPLQWDSDFFGYPVARITASAIPADKLAELLDEAKKKKIRLVYLFADPADHISSETAAVFNAKLVDRKITFHMKINESVVTPVDDHIQQFEQQYPSEKLTDLAMQSGLYSRYKTDPGFINKEFERMYLAWIENSVNKKIADHTFVYYENGIELGFVTLKARDNYGQIGLIAVDENSRGKSIGKKLIAAVTDQLYKKNIPDLDVATQVDNEDACNFYRKAGFNESKAENIYHIWL